MVKKTKNMILDEYANELVKKIEAKTLATGKKRTIPIIYYVKMILYVIISGTTWEDLDRIPDLKCKGNSIKRQFLRWRDRGIFNEVHKESLEKYIKEQESIDKIFIDSTDILNKNGTEEQTGFGFKFKNKRAIRLHCSCDSNNVLHSAIFTPANVADVTMTVDLLNNFFIDLAPTYRNPLYVGADKGYISEDNKKKLKENNICLVYPYKSNQKKLKKRNRKKHKDLLKKRYIIEHTNSFIHRGYKRLNQLYDRSNESLMTFIKIFNTCQILRSEI